ncbi:hypothetical protein SteCoe_16005 [Stentor coeruleus]|uniref:Uncharacterized protein n=1 Tax=Stentor coeruleus TaxID=5963 RepID=A0A1R2C2E6_9CILI|nr:hypothetical protein SteCoe_16005 [Stentor coeruleus]
MEIKLLSSSSIYHCSNSASSKLRIVSPLSSEKPLNHTSKGSGRLNQFANYLKTFVKTKKPSLSPVVTLKRPRISSQDYTINKNRIKTRKTSYSNNQPQIKSIKHTRPARFLSQKDIENHLGVKEKPQKIPSNKEDMRILIENNHSQQLKSFEVDKICRLYATGFKKSNLAKKDDWKWHSPEKSSRNVTFQESL